MSSGKKYLETHFCVIHISFVFAICITPISALDDWSDDIDDNKNETLQTETLYFSCTYDDKTKKININPSIRRGGIRL